MKIEDLFKCEPYELKDVSGALENLSALLPKLQKLEVAFGGPFIITSAFRSWAEHKSVYQSINDKRLIVGLSPLPIPLHSKHLSGHAADIADPNGDLKIWVASNKTLLEEIGLWCEAFKYTPIWVHFQDVAPASKLRFFRP